VCSQSFTVRKMVKLDNYITNTNLNEKIVINRYHDLWKVEKSFRLTKTDLKARPIFLRLDQTIKVHLVIVFAGLAICKYIEITTGKSIQRVLKLTNKILTHKVTNTKTGEVKYLETAIHDPGLKQEITILKKLLGH